MNLRSVSGSAGSPQAPLRAEGDEQAARSDSPSPVTSSFPDRKNISQRCKIKVWDDF